MTDRLLRPHTDAYSTSSYPPPAKKSTRPPAQVFTQGMNGSVKTICSPTSTPYSPTSSSRAYSYLTTTTSITNKWPNGRSRSQTDKNEQGIHTSPRSPSTYNNRLPWSPPLATSRRTRLLQGVGGSYMTSTGSRIPPDFSSSDDLEGSVQSAPSLGRNYEEYHSTSTERTARTENRIATATPISSSSTGNVDGFNQHVMYARRIVDDLMCVQGTQQLSAVMMSACDLFDHHDETKHNSELYHGAAHALSKLLLSSMNDDEIRMICAALEMVFRASPKAVQLALERIGLGFVTQLLLVAERVECSNMRHASVCLLNICKIISYLCQCPDLRVGLCRHRGLLTLLTKQSPRLGSTDIRLIRLRTIGNLAQADDNKAFLYNHDGLVDYIIRVSHFDNCENCRHNGAMSLAELSTAPTNQVPMANQPRLLSALVKIILVEKDASTRDASITAIQNLAFLKQNRLKLVTFKKGIVLEALKKTLSSDPDPKTRRRAAGALTNLTCEETAEIIGNHKGILDTLAVVTTKDESLEVQARTSVALTKIASGITVAMDCHDTLLDSLVAASLSEASQGIAAVLRVKARDPANREALAHHTGVVDTLCDICVSDKTKATDCDNAVRALMHLVNEDKNRKLLCNSTVLDSLVCCANFKDALLVEARDSAIRALERLATELSNRRFMARHKGLLVAVAHAVERESCWEEAGQVSDHGYLAKPLLMTLLVAM